MRPMSSFFYYTCLSLILCAVPVFAADAQINEATPLTPKESPRTAASTGQDSVGIDVSIVAEKRLSFDDVYRIELQLPIPGHVEVHAIHGDEIIIRLEKHGRGHNEQRVQAYLKHTDVTALKDSDALHLSLSLPEILPSDLELTRLNCVVHTPPDVALEIRTQNGDIRVNEIRGDLNLQAITGHIRLNKTMGGYRVLTGEGRIHGEILMTNSSNQFDTASGTIDLILLDGIAAPTDLTATDGEITLRLPKSFQADVEIRSKSRDPQSVVIELPTKIESVSARDTLHGWINGGGPLFRLTAKGRIAIVPLDLSSVEKEVAEESTTSETALDSHYAVPKAEHPPIIDGNLFERAWSDAIQLHPFYEANGVDVPDEQTQAFLMWDERHLYIGVRVYSLDMGELQISQTKSGSPVWNDDCLEILVDPNPETELYYHLVVNPLGTVFTQTIRSARPHGVRPPLTDTKSTGDTRTALIPEFPPDSQIEMRADHIKASLDSQTTLAEIETHITTRYWSVEVAVKRSALEPEPTGDWKVNLHQKAQENREFSYSSPAFDAEMPWWPHWRKRMRHFQFTETIDESSLLHIEDTLAIESIEVQGNSEISATEIIQQIPFRPGDLITSHQLSWLLAELENHPWFRKVGLETMQPHQDTRESTANIHQALLDTPNEKVQKSTEVYATSDNRQPELPLKVVLRLYITESPCFMAQQLNLTGNEHFNSEELCKWFDLVPGRIPIDVLSTKTRLIRQLYRNQGYQLARVKEQFVEDALEIVIDEGRLDEVRFTGIRRLEKHELAREFGLHAGDIYNLLESDTQINLTRTKLKRLNPIFKDFRNRQAKREQGKNLLVIDVEEHPPIQLKFSPRFNFNRVHGLALGIGSEASTEEHGRGRAFGSLNFGLGSSIWNHQLGAEKPWFEHLELRIGGSWYKMTGVVDSGSLSADEGILSAVVLGESYFDYYQRQGYQAWLIQKLTSSTGLMLEFTDEQHENLDKSTDWSLTNHDRTKRSNARIDTGNARMLSICYRFDSRDWKSYRKEGLRSVPQPNEHTRRGWRGELSVEYAGGQLGSDFDFTLYRLEVIRYNRLSDTQNLDFRVIGGFSDAPLPRQRLLHTGPVGALRGYDPNRFMGDNILAVNVEYKTRREFVRPSKGISAQGTASLFVDIGDTWFDNENFELHRLHTSVGVGFSISTNTTKTSESSNALRVEIVRPLQKQHGINVILRLAQVF